MARVKGAVKARNGELEYCEIRTLFVVEAWRGRGFGLRLMEAAESEVRRRSCDRIILSTHGFQTPGFYEKLGYRCVGQVDDCPAGTATG